MTDVNSTKSMNHLYIRNDIFNIEGSFVYRKFEPFEQIDEQLEKRPSWCDQNEDYPVLFTEGTTKSNVARYVQLSWEGGELQGDIFKGDVSFVQGQQIFFNSDLQQGMVLYTTNEQDDIQSQNSIISDGVSEKNKLDYLLSQSRRSPFTELIEEDLKEGAGTSSVPVLNPTTMKPLTMTSVDNNRYPAPDILLAADSNKQIISTSYRSPFTGEKLFDQIDVADSLSRKINAFPRGNPFFNFLTTFTQSENLTVDNLYIHSNPADDVKEALLSGFVLIGYAIIKYRVDNSVKSYMYTRFVTTKSYRDPYVGYGKTYQYEIRAVYGIYRDEKRQLYMFGSDEGANISIECTELKVPNPPKTLSFVYEGQNKIKVSWKKPATFVEDDDRLWDTDDIKGYQILYRHSLTEPYRLLKYFKFNNTMPKKYRMYSKEYIPDIYVVNLETAISELTDSTGAPIYKEPTEWILEIRPNVDYYFTMCSIDAHGNSSNYSSQYKVRRNNVTGEVQSTLVSPTGAPKQYPNLLIPNELVEPVMKASGYKYLDIHYCPDTKYSKPNVNTGGPSFNLQLFELETQTEKNIKITINEEQN